MNNYQNYLVDWLHGDFVEGSFFPPESTEPGRLWNRIDNSSVIHRFVGKDFSRIHGQGGL